MQAETVVNQGVPLPCDEGETLRRKVEEYLETALRKARNLIARQTKLKQERELESAFMIEQKLKQALVVMDEHTERGRDYV